MKYILATLLFIGNMSFGQVDTTANNKMMGLFIENYNEDDFNEIFSFFSEEMKAALPIDKTTEFLKGLKSQAGIVHEKTFLKYVNDSYASYKTQFEHADMIVSLSIDETSKINGLFVKPKVEELTIKKGVNNLANNTSGITENQLELMFENSCFFPNNTEISVGIIKNGKVSFMGIKRVNDTIIYINNSKNLFEIGSITKTFTSALLADFIVKKKIKSAKENINDYLDFSLHNETKISFESLANHTSGLPRLPPNLDLEINPENPYTEYDAKDLKEYLSNILDISEDSKGRYEYSNLGMGLLGFTLTEMEGITYENLIEEIVFSKYEMTNSSLSKNKINESLVKGLDQNGAEVSNWDFSVLVGAGGILSNVEDLSKFLFAQFDEANEALAMTREKTFDINDQMDIGMGWHILKKRSDDLRFTHSGGTGGYTSSIVFDLKNSNGIIVLSNVSAFNPNKTNIDKLCFQLMKTLYSE